MLLGVVNKLVFEVPYYGNRVPRQCIKSGSWVGCRSRSILDDNGVVCLVQPGIVSAGASKVRVRYNKCPPGRNSRGQADQSVTVVITTCS